MRFISEHQKGQIKVIDEIERQVKNKAVDFSTVSPINDYEKDPRLCLTSVHFPKKTLIEKVQHDLIDPLRKISPDYFYYPASSLHMTIKNIRTINNPPNFTEEEVEKARKVLAKVVPKHKKFRVYFYRLLLFPSNVALMGTTDSELDGIIFDLDKELKRAGIPDDKKYSNARYFFCNMTLVRFTFPVIEAFSKKMAQLSASVNFRPYLVDSVTLITANASLSKCRKIEKWNLV